MRGGQEDAMVRLMQLNNSCNRSIRCDNSDSLESQKGEGKERKGETVASSGSCGAGDVFGWSDSIARTVHRCVPLSVSVFVCVCLKSLRRVTVTRGCADSLAFP